MKATTKITITLTTNELETIKSFFDILYQDNNLDAIGIYDILQSISQEDGIVLEDYGYALNII